MPVLSVRSAEPAVMPRRLGAKQSMARCMALRVAALVPAANASGPW
jgi:hypothetical protein